jgi:isoamylase
VKAGGVVRLPERALLVLARNAGRGVKVVST